MNMKNLKLLAVLGLCLMFAPAAAHAATVGVAIGVGPVVVGSGPAPVCEYGYYSYYPYACAPYGYYGPEWFSGGVFIGAGPWFHGYRGFYGRPGYYAGRGNYGRMAAPAHPAFRGEVNRGAVGHVNGGAVRGGTGVARGGGFHDGGRR
jgi:hypothetical protein